MNFDEEKLEFYVLNYDPNRKQVYMFNIFDNINVREATLKLLDDYYDDVFETFDDFVEALKHTVAWQEKSRREYEISVADAFETDIRKLEKWECYIQFAPNAEMFARYLVEEY